ncbi:Peptidylprolyl isomerase [Sphingomonas paucimobilis]|nr:Peptidylprolyl isomerase [Sphingomonas paucimobilis]
MPALALPANRSAPGYTRVAIETSAGTIVVAVDMVRAPRTSVNFLTYVDDGRFDGVTFYRAARRKSDPKLGLIQGGIDTDARRSLPPIPHEPTTKTGIRHLDGTISMARPNRPDSAMGNFFITLGATPNMDARGDLSAMPPSAMSSLAWMSRAGYCRSRPAAAPGRCAGR